MNKNTDVFAGFPVADTTGKIKGVSYVHVDAAKAVMAVHKGGYASSMTEHNAISQYMAGKGLKRKFVVEEYPVGPHENPDSNQWVTNIYYLIEGGK